MQLAAPTPAPARFPGRTSVKRLLAFAIAASIVSSACGSSNPASPSSGDGSGAVITGFVAGSGGMGATAGSGRTTADPLTAGLTVSVAGTTYYGNVDPVQLAWLERDLALVAPETTVVTFNHIPFFSAGALLDGLIEAPASRSIVEINGRTVFRHVVTNAGDVLRVLRTRRHALALGGHVHLRERITFEVEGVQTRFEQASAIVGSRPNANKTLNFRSGVTVYRVKGSAIDEGEFVGLDGTPR